MPAIPSLPRPGTDSGASRTPVANAPARKNPCAEPSLRPAPTGGARAEPWTTEPRTGEPRVADPRATTAGPPPADAPTVPRIARTPEPETRPPLAWRRPVMQIRTLLLGLLGTALLALGGIGAGGTLVRDPLIVDSALSWVRYGHGRDLATGVVYVGVAFLVWAWVRLGREVRAERTNAHGVLTTVAAWVAPLVIAPPLFSRDVYSYLAQGNLALHGFDPYEVGPSVLPGPLTDNVSWLWQNTIAPYGPLFVLAAKGVVAVTGNSVIAGVLVMRLLMLTGLAMLCWALPGLVRHLGGRTSVALWLAVANPLALVHLVAGAHNDQLMIGLLALGTVFVLDRRHVAGIALITLAAAVKATAVVVLPFLVWVWASRLTGSPWSRFARAAGTGLAVFVGLFTTCTVLAGVDLGWISGLKTSAAIVNWLSLPTGLGMLAHSFVGLFVDVGYDPFIYTGRALGTLLLAYIGIRQWWAARDGDPREAVRRASIVLVAVAVLAHATLPWYFTWALALAAGLTWRLSAMVPVVGGSVWLLLVTYPSGNSALESWGFLGGALLVSALASVSLVRHDPLGLSSRSGRARA
ncbi:alpha-1,6-mannosyltransferase [Streptoalloteichus tenebrarius]|uniref:Alpha-1,6-mannosyltransferase n=1 Tax=Streptoalloteichus tenebrarius (strain ATCC 17920 / DSM 40477 / JCM 4838 / CBS 697.72 / NBRC 16177 / NCIMB 11028 / NRRL B-12390 / A12253. 1 / ISP 5477) TaxID=1933 RepID=A0ABT1HMK3_STRSD|nr:polyprenol phosphomannose-dependent alpha 1,6 mannosyltransferase MptB [Streptoalloteichus tenebrarius]MCP2256730.1 alpha-1,6-mannosyltransferase [Streptoalloteichus tenebrarius]